MSKQQPATIQFLSKNTVLSCSGDWTLHNLKKLKRNLKKFSWPSDITALTVSVASITKIDTAGAWVLQSILAHLEKNHTSYKLQGVTTEQQALLDLIRPRFSEIKDIPTEENPGLLFQIGKSTVTATQRIPLFLNFLGETFTALVQSFVQPKHIYFKQVLGVLQNSGYRALPIIGLLAFLIGVVLAYQMGLQLRNYGADIYIVDLIGISVLREFGPLITAIILAGRTGSAFTAQLGTMKINQEIDALRTMGINPIDLLVLPKIFGMLIVLPLLTVWADCFGILGGMVMAKSMLDINFGSFIDRFDQAISVTTYSIGLFKSPVFALLIATIGCYQGFQVQLSADSVGKKTTISVVQAIFFIIVADAIFSIYFRWRGI